MRQNNNSSSPKSKLQKAYSFCRTAISIILTVIALIPVIYLLGTDQSFYANQPLYSAYAQSNYFQTKISEIQSAMNNTFVINVYSQQGSEKKDSSIKQWQNLRQFVSYLGYYLNKNGMVTVDRIITPPEIKQQKKSKSNTNTDNQLLLQKAYDLHSINELNTLRNKINKVATGSMNRLKIKLKQPKDNSFTQKLKYGAVRQVLGQRIWIITIDPDYHQYHSSQQLRKELTIISKQRELDRFIVVSIAPADSQWKKMKPISINIDGSILENIKDSIKKVVRSYFQFQINATRLIQTILCRSQTSLLQLNHFLSRCNTTFSCYNSIKLSRKTKQQKDNIFAPLLTQLCNDGHFDEDDLSYKSSLRQLGFYINQQGNQQIEETLKIYYQIGNGKKCKGNKKCNYEWLSDQQKQKKIIKTQPKPIKSIKTNKTTKTKQPQKKQPFIKQNIIKVKPVEKKVNNQTKTNKVENKNVKELKDTKNISKPVNQIKTKIVAQQKNTKKVIKQTNKPIKQVAKQSIIKKELKDKVSSKTKSQQKPISKQNKKQQSKNKILKNKKERQQPSKPLKQQQVTKKAEEVQVISPQTKPEVKPTTTEENIVQNTLKTQQKQQIFDIIQDVPQQSTTIQSKNQQPTPEQSDQSDKQVGQNNQKEQNVQEKQTTTQPPTEPSTNTGQAESPQDQQSHKQIINENLKQVNPLNQVSQEIQQQNQQQDTEVPQIVQTPQASQAQQAPQSLQQIPQQQQKTEKQGQQIEEYNQQAERQQQSIEEQKQLIQEQKQQVVQQNQQEVQSTPKQPIQQSSAQPQQQIQQVTQESPQPQAPHQDQETHKDQQQVNDS